MRHRGKRRWGLNHLCLNSFQTSDYINWGFWGTPHIYCPFQPWSWTELGEKEKWCAETLGVYQVFESTETNKRSKDRKKKWGICGNNHYKSCILDALMSVFRQCCGYKPRDPAPTWETGKVHGGPLWIWVSVSVPTDHNCVVNEYGQCLLCDWVYPYGIDRPT